MLKELNQTIAAVCSMTATTAAALEDGSKILRIKGVAATQVAALEAVKAIKEASKDASNEEIKAAQELLALID